MTLGEMLISAWQQSLVDGKGAVELGSDLSRSLSFERRSSAA